MPSPRERPADPAGLGRLEQGCVPVAVVQGELEVFAESRERGRVDRHGPGLRALAADPEVRHAPVLVERSDCEARDLPGALVLDCDRQGIEGRSHPSPAQCYTSDKLLTTPMRVVGQLLSGPVRPL